MSLAFSSLVWLQKVVTQTAVPGTLQPDTFYEEPRTTTACNSCRIEVRISRWSQVLW